MINLFRNFTKKKLAGLVLILVIIIAFGFGGFGGGFNTGNQNNIARINNKKISTQDFMNYLNSSGLSQQVIKENIDKNILEELLSSLVSLTLLNLEIQNLNLKITDQSISENLKKNKNFLDENGFFQRTLYEKFLLTKNINAPMYEIKLKNNILQKQLFTYISGGAKSPKFLIQKHYKEKNRKLEIEYVNLKNFYKNTNEFTELEIKSFINENSENLKQDYIDFSYAIITPNNLTGSDEFNQLFFDKIDEIENKIAKNIDFKTIITEFNITPSIKRNYVKIENKETVENKIYNSRDNKIEILEDNGTYIFYQIDKINSKLPSLSDVKFKSQITNLLFQKEKYKFNTSILEKIESKKFTQTSFEEFGINNIKNIKLNSIEDNEKFETNSVEVLYSLPTNTFTLITDDKSDIFVAKIINYEDVPFSENSKDFNAISNEASAENRNTMLKSYDYLLNDKYNVVVNEKTLNRVKNYFK
jgi:peptidyl-prolyl cis-trans isomerase D